jgi:hypothetical protein
VINSLWVFARVDTDKHGVTMLKDLAKPGKERRHLVSLKIA